MSSSRSGLVGIFWGVPRSVESWIIVSDATELQDAESYGDFLTHPHGHYEVWEAWQRLGSVGLKQKGLPLAILQSEYEQLPRGRIVYRKLTHDFIVYADRKLQRPKIIAEIAERFSLTSCTFTVQSDAHYRS
jgi:hypothetical protein